MKFDLSDFLELDTKALLAVNGGASCSGGSCSSSVSKNTGSCGSSGSSYSGSCSSTGGSSYGGSCGTSGGNCSSFGGSCGSYGGSCGGTCSGLSGYTGGSTPVQDTSWGQLTNKIAIVIILPLFLKKLLRTDFQYEYLGAAIFSESVSSCSTLENNSSSDKPNLVKS